MVVDGREINGWGVFGNGGGRVVRVVDEDEGRLFGGGSGEEGSKVGCRVQVWVC